MVVYELCVEFGETWLAGIVENQDSVDHRGYY